MKDWLSSASKLATAVDSYELQYKDGAVSEGALLHDRQLRRVAFPRINAGRSLTSQELLRLVRRCFGELRTPSFTPIAHHDDGFTTSFLQDSPLTPPVSAFHGSTSDSHPQVGYPPTPCFYLSDFEGDSGEEEAAAEAPTAVEPPSTLHVVLYLLSWVRPNTSSLASTLTQLVHVNIVTTAAPSFDTCGSQGSFQLIVVQTDSIPSPR